MKLWGSCVGAGISSYASWGPEASVLTLWPYLPLSAGRSHPWCINVCGSTLPPPPPTHTLTLTMGREHNWVSLVLSPTVFVPSPPLPMCPVTHERISQASDCMGVLQLFSARLGPQNALLTGLPRGYCAPCSPAPHCCDVLPWGPIPLTWKTA